MSINIKNSHAEYLVHELTRLTGKSITQTVILALEEKLKKEKGRGSVRGLKDEIMDISARCSKLPTLDERSSEVILHYNESGLPE